jgi:O-methyltransferase
MRSAGRPNAGGSTLLEPNPLPTAIGAAADNSSARWLYLELLKKCLTRAICADTTMRVEPNWIRSALDPAVYDHIEQFLTLNGFEVVRRFEFNPSERVEGRDWPAGAETMVGTRRLDNVQDLVLSILHDGVPGDLIETGVWRGGCTILMRAVLKVWPDTNRTVWVADSFQGLPPPDAETFPEDSTDELFKETRLAVSIETVKENFEKYGLLDRQVQFLKGWFRDTLPAAPIDRLALMRLDGDMYESTIVALESLYPKLSVGGYVIIDDFALLPCRKAVHDFRMRYGIVDELTTIDWSGVFWRRTT